MHSEPGSSIVRSTRNHIRCIALSLHSEVEVVLVDDSNDYRRMWTDSENKQLCDGTKENLLSDFVHLSMKEMDTHASKHVAETPLY